MSYAKMLKSGVFLDPVQGNGHVIQYFKKNKGPEVASGISQHDR